jgi:hypothetical protein
VVTANGVSGSVANPTSTPAITLALAAITPTTVTPSSLVDLSGAAAGQIKFPAAQNPSADANTLDDYEEGTWTPTDVSGAGLTFSYASGIYVKIGKLVWVNFIVAFPVTASGAAVKIGGLPFSVEATQMGAASASFTTTSLNILYYIRENSTQIECFLNTGVAVTNLQCSSFIIECAGCYRASA